MSFTFSENCASATMTWTHTGGTADGSSPHVKSLTGPELNAGAHNGIIITNNPTLVSGAVYSIAYNCLDAAGNAATTVTNTNITFDNTPPTVSIQNLLNNSTVHTGHAIGPATDNVGVTQVQFNLDSTTWNNAAYTAPNSKFALPMGASTWRDRSLHTIQVRAVDAAGNETLTSVINVRKGNNRDINGDGYGDVAVGAFKYLSYRGRLYVFFGSSLGITATTESAANHIITGETTPSNFGRSSALCDFNGDGFADLAVSATAYSSNAGRAYIFYGGASGLTTTNPASATQITGAASESFSSPLVAGDVNKDGYCDVLIGSVAYSSSLGRAFLFYSSGASGISGGASSSANATFTGEAPAGQASSSLGIADFDGDGNADILIGAPAATTNSGIAYVVYGTASPFTGNTNLVNSANVVTTGGAAINMGGSSAVGDFNGDGASDLGTGGYGTFSVSSIMRVFYGAVSTQLLQNNTAPLQTTVTESTMGMFLTTSAASGDLNADGYDELCVGAHGGTMGMGYVAVFFGASTPLSATLPTHAGYLRDGSGLVVTGEQFGRALGISDVNGDGYGDLLVGANFFTMDTGKIFIFHSSSSGPAATPAGAVTGTSGSEFGISFAR